MTNMTTYEFTAFTEADLLDAGAAGHSLNCGDSFTMPGAATICFEVTDNDAALSGDNWCNENANDWYGQQAAIIDAETGLEVGNGGQIYAEKYWKLIGDDGQVYYLIEIEQENGNAPGQGDDYFTFYGAVPPEGVELCVVSGGNIKGDWLKYKHFDAGVKFEPDPDGTICIEAEDLELSGYKVEHQAAASGDELIKLACNVGYAKLPSFNGESCVYDISITVIDENDGQGFLDVFVDGEFVGCFQLDQDNGGNGVHNVSFSTLTLKGVEIPEGAEITLKGRGDDYEFIRIDKLAFDKVEFRVCDDPDAVNLGFDGFAAGDKLTDIDGLTISAIGGSGDAMVFDSQNPTGGDGDLETQVTQQGNVLIISEDGDSSDPDDAIGGTIRIDFDNPAKVFDLKVIDTEEGGTITATLADGSTVEIDIPEIANGGVAQVLIDLEDVVSLDIVLDGSGGIDDLCYVPGAPQTATISGRYFCDVNRDETENDGNGGLDIGVAGALVALVDPAGTVVATTTTDADGFYSFIDVAPGEYAVRFQDPEEIEGGVGVGKAFIDDGVGDETVDSDVTFTPRGEDGFTETFTVAAGDDVTDIDAGIEVMPSSIAGRYFCDENRNDVDDGEAGLNGIQVTLVNLDTGATLTTTTATLGGVEGSYIFKDLEAGRYQVTFAADPDGKAFVAPNDPDQNGDDANDSDAILNSDGTASSQIIGLEAGQDVTDIDAGVENLDPEAADDVGEVCYDEILNIDVLANDADPNGDALAVTAINGQAFDANGQVVLANGVVVTLEADGTLSVDGENATVGGEAVADLLFDETATDSFIYTTSDGNGGEATANVDVTFKGATDTLEKFDVSLEPLLVSGQLFDDATFGDDIYAFDITSIEPSDSPFAEILDGLADGGPIDLTFCISIATFIDPAPVVNDFTVGILDEASYLTAMEGAVDVADFDSGPNSDDGGFNGENIDNVNWLLNEAENLIAEGFSQGNIQRAIWNLTDGGENDVLEGTAANFFFSQNPEFGEAAPALELSNRALMEGEGFVAGEGDKVGIVLDPVVDGVQPLVIAVDYDDLILDCLC